MSRLAWNSALLTVLSGLTLVAGLVLYPFIAGRFEARQTDAFFLAMTVPWLIIGPVMNAVSLTLIPVLTECRHRRPEGVSSLVGSAITWGAMLSAIAAVALAALTPVGLTLLRASMNPEDVARVTANTMLLLPLVVLQTVTSVLDASSNSAGCFWLPASATLLRQLVTLVAIAALQVPLGDRSLAVGFTLGAVGHLGLVLAFWRHARTTVRLGWQLPQELRVSWRLAVPLLVATAALQVATLLSRFVAATLGPGSVTALDYAYRVANAVIEVSSSGVLLVILADWSTAVSSGNAQALRAKLRNAMPLILFTMLPMVFVLHALRLPVVSLWLGPSGVAPGFLALTAATLGVLLLGVPLDIAARVYARAFLVTQRTGILAWAALGRLAVSGLLFFVLARRLGVPGIALADVAGILLVFVGLSLAARARLGGSVDGMMGRMLRLLGAAGAGWLTASALVPALGTVAPAALILTVGVASLMAYILSAWALGLPELRAIRTLAFTWRDGRART